MLFKSSYFDELRSQAEGTFSGHKAIKLIFEIINALEKLSNQLVEEKIDLAKHDEHGRVVLDDDRPLKMENED